MNIGLVSEGEPCLLQVFLYLFSLLLVLVYFFYSHFQIFLWSSPLILLCHQLIVCHFQLLFCSHFSLFIESNQDLCFLLQLFQFCFIGCFHRLQCIALVFQDLLTFFQFTFLGPQGSQLWTLKFILWLQFKSFIREKLIFSLSFSKTFLCFIDLLLWNGCFFSELSVFFLKLINLLSYCCNLTWYSQNSIERTVLQR